jgi:alanine racemase
MSTIRSSLDIERAVARVNTSAIQRNCQRLRSELRDGVLLCAVVKADGYGHGLLESAHAALLGGAGWLALASVDEASALLDEVRAPLLVLGPVRPLDVERAVACDLELVAWHEELVHHAADLAAELGKSARIHVKLDTGMGRFGVREHERASRVVAAAAASSHVELVGVMTHFATADRPGDDFFAEQLQRFATWAAEVKRQHPHVLAHAANSAALLRDPAAHFDMVRCGIAIYGMDPFGHDPLAQGLEPALELRSYVATVKLCRAGESTGYGRRFIAPSDTHLGLLPIGYGDGWRRGLSGNADVLIAGRRHPLVGTVSMDSVAVDLGPDPAAAHALLDQPAVLIGRQGEERILAEDLARRLDTINYEITCGLGPRVARVYREDDGTGADHYPTVRPVGEA